MGAWGNGRTPPIAVQRGRDGDLGDLIEDLHRRGWSVTGGWDAPERPWDLAGSRLVFVGDVVDEADAASVAELAARGAGIVARTDLADGPFEALIEDLREVGPVEVVGGRGRPMTQLTEEQRQVLRLLADGHTLGSAAEHLHVSRRTAARRLDAAKRSLGVDSTVEAVRTLLESDR